MRSVLPLFLNGLLVVFVACQHSSASNDTSGSTGTAVRPAMNDPLSPPPSMAHFTDAEQKLAIGEYRFAAVQLQKGIIAYRIETGKMRGHTATRANRAIDALIVLRQNLRNGKPVRDADLHQAIETALLVEGKMIPLPDTPPSDRNGLFVPVGGN